MSLREEADYYTWRELEGRLPGAGEAEVVRWAAKPGLGLERWNEPDPAVRLILKLWPEPGAVPERLLLLNAGVGGALLGVWAWRRDAKIRELWLADDHGVAVEAIRRTLELNGLFGGRVRVVHGDAYDGLRGRPSSFDAAVVRLPKGKERARRLVDLALWALRPEGWLLIAGPKRGGVRGAIAHAVARLGEAALAAEVYGGGWRAARFTKPQDVQLERPEAGFVVRTGRACGRRWRFVVKPGVFAWEGLDPGTALLLEALCRELRPQDEVLDLGCGSGLVGLVAAHKAVEGRVVLVDVSAAALECARRTLQLYSIPCPRVEVRYSDVISAVEGERFDVVATYPPAHQGWAVDREVAEQFIVDAGQVLKPGPGGRLYVVGAAGLPVKRWLRAHYGEGRVETLEDVGSHQLYRVRV